MTNKWEMRIKTKIHVHMVCEEEEKEEEKRRKSGGGEEGGEED